MAIQLDPIPSGALTDARGNGLPPLVRWMNAVRAAFAGADSGGIWRAQDVRVAHVGGGVATPQQVGFNCLLLVGGISGGNTYTAPSGTAALDSLYRVVHASGGSANSYGGCNTQTAAFWLGNAASLGGFRVEVEFGVETTQTTLKAVVGLVPSASLNIAASEPSAILNCVFMGADAGDTNMQIMHNDGSGTCTKVDLGASFPKTAGVLYRLVLEATANSSTVDYTVTRLDSSATATGTVTSDLPSSTTQMNLQWVFGNGATAADASGAFIRALAETPF